MKSLEPAPVLGRMSGRVAPEVRSTVIDPPSQSKQAVPTLVIAWLVVLRATSAADLRDGDEDAPCDKSEKNISDHAVRDACGTAEVLRCGRSRVANSVQS